MKEHIQPAVVILGRENPPKHFFENWSIAKQKKRQEIEREYPPAEMSPKRRLFYDQLESQMDWYFYRKMRRYGTTKTRKLPRASYSRFSVQQQDSGLVSTPRTQGFYNSDARCIVMNADESTDSFNKMCSLAHEKSHSSVSRVGYWYLSKDKFVHADGLVINGNMSPKAALLEECMIHMDVMNITNTLRRSLPNLYKQRVDLFNSGTFDATLRAINTDLYGEVTPEIAAGYIVIGQNGENPYLSFAIKRYIFGRQICETVGRALRGDRSETTTSEVAIRTGFQMLDRDRYLRTNEAHRKIVDVFGGRRAKTLFAFPHNIDNMDEAMALIMR